MQSANDKDTIRGVKHDQSPASVTSLQPANSNSKSDCAGREEGEGAIQIIFSLIDSCEINKLAVRSVRLILPAGDLAVLRALDH